MQISEERIKEVLRQLINSEEAEEIIFYLRGKTNISEFIIAEELDLEIHKTRKLLYKLHDLNVVTFKRKKDKIKGWYICYWDFNEDSIPRHELKLQTETLEKLNDRLANESNNFYYMCRFAHARLTFDDAFEEDFKCPECGELMNQVNNSRTIEFLKGRIVELEKEAERDRQIKEIERKKLKAEKDRILQEIKEAEIEKKAKAELKAAKKATKKVVKKVTKKVVKKVTKKVVKKVTKK